jgi:hypothetical protein
MTATSARTFISHDPPIAEPDDPELSMREADKQKRINLEGTLPPRQHPLCSGSSTNMVC